MKIEYDRTKSERNARQRNLPFALAAEFDWETALYMEDVRRPYPERRFVAVGLLNDRLHVMCFTPMAGGVRIISLRKANAREVVRYAEKTEDALDE